MSQIRKPDLSVGGAGYARIDDMPVQRVAGGKFSEGETSGKTWDKSFSPDFLPEPRDKTRDKVRRKDGRSGRNWRNVTDAPDQWTGEHFMVRLIWAYHILNLTPAGRHARPKEYGTAWPQFSYKFEDLVAQADREQSEIQADENRRNYNRPVVTGLDIGRMDSLFNTVYRLRSLDHTTASMLIAWAYARYRNISIDLVAARYNCSKKYLYEKISTFAKSCAISMIGDKIAPW